MFRFVLAEKAAEGVRQLATTDQRTSPQTAA